MMKYFTTSILGAFFLYSTMNTKTANSFSLTMTNGHISSTNKASVRNRRAFFSDVTAVTVATTLLPSASIAATPEILTTAKGVKYAITKKPSEKGAIPQPNDIVAVEYTGYLTSGQIFDATHSEGKKNALLFQLGSNAVIPGLNDVISNMAVGEKVQAIIPPSLAYGDKGVCIEDGECLIKPGSTLVYDVLLKRSSIPPP